MASNPGPYNPAATEQNQFDRLGIPGKYYHAIKVEADTTASFTGSQYGAHAFMLGNGADDAKTEIHVVGGGKIMGPDLTEKVIYDISPHKIHPKGGAVYVFKRQQ